MATVTKPMLLDETGKSMLTALQSIATNCGGSGSTVNYTTVSALPTALVDNTIYILNYRPTTLAINIPSESKSGILIRFTAGSGCTLSFNSTPKWNTYTPSYTLTAGTEYMLSILDGIFGLNEIV